MLTIFKISNQIYKAKRGWRMQVSSYDKGAGGCRVFGELQYETVPRSDLSISIEISWLDVQQSSDYVMPTL